MNFLKVIIFVSLGMFLTSCGNDNYNNTGKSVTNLYSPDTPKEKFETIAQEQQEFLIDNSVYIEDVGWDYSPQDDMNTFGDNNSQLELEIETDAPPRLQFKDRQFP